MRILVERKNAESKNTSKEKISKGLLIQLQFIVSPKNAWIIYSSSHILHLYMKGLCWSCVNSPFNIFFRYFSLSALFLSTKFIHTSIFVCHNLGWRVTVLITRFSIRFFLLRIPIWSSFHDITYQQFTINDQLKDALRILPSLL